MRWTRFLSFAADSKKEIDHTWEEFIDHVQHAGPYAVKSVCPWLKGATFGEIRTDKGSLRHNGNVLNVTFLEADFDAENVSFLEAVERLEKHNVKALVYTTPSYTHDKPRWRAIAPLSKPCSPDQRAYFLARLNGALGNIITAESFTLSQAYFYGKVEGHEYHVRHTFDSASDGFCIDELPELDQIAAKPAPKAIKPQDSFDEITRNLGRKLRTKDGRRELLKSYIGERSRRGLNIRELEVLVQDVVQRYFDPDDPVDAANIHEIINDFSTHDAKERQRAEEIVGPFVQQARQALQAKEDFGGRIRPSNVNFGQLRPIKWVIDDFIAAGEMVVWAGQPGVGKSTVFAGIAMCVAGFGPDIGSSLAVDRVRKVLIVSEHAVQYERIFHAFCARFQLDYAAVQEKITLFDSARLQRQEIVKEISALIERGMTDEPPLLMLDTASSTFDLRDENDNAEVAAYVAELKILVLAYYLPLWIIAHAAKALGREDSEITPRGASAWIGDAHGTGSVFRDPNFPKSVFVKSLKCRNERAFTELEIQTEVLSFQVADDRGVIQTQRIRIGVPSASDEGVRLEAHRSAQETKNALKTARAREEIKNALVEALRASQGQFLSKRQLRDMVPGKDVLKSELLDGMIADGIVEYVPRPPEEVKSPRATHFVRFPENKLTESIEAENEGNG